MSEVPPTCHGVNKLNERECRKMKVYDWFAKIEPKDWSNLKIISVALIDSKNDDQYDAKKANRTICSMLTNISLRTNDVCLKIYCKNLVKYFKNDSVKKKFAIIYNETVQEHQLQTIQKTINGQQKINSAKSVLLATKEAEKLLDSSLLIIPSSSPLSPSPSSSSLSSTLTQYDPEKEVDDMYINNSTLSVGTILKKAAISNHDIYVNGKNLNPNERKVMANGLSSVLDLIDLTNDGQASLFQKNEWNELKTEYMNKYGSGEVGLPKELDEIWCVIVKLCETDNDVETARQYVHRMKSSSLPTKIIKSLEVVDEILKIYDRHCFLLNPNNAAYITENDYLCKIWIPVLDALFAIDNLIRTKTGESTAKYSANEKKQVYDDINGRICSFKIDIQFIHDQNNDQIQVGVAEFARNTKHSKILSDSSKLIREGKDILDFLLNQMINDEGANQMKGLILQVAGLTGEISTIHLDRPGLYVAIPQLTIHFPSSISSISDFTQSLANIFWFGDELSFLAKILKRQMQILEKKNKELLSVFNRSNEPIPPHFKKQWFRPTWYTPPRNDVASSKVPTNIFGDHIIIDRSIFKEDERANNKKQNDKNADKFGWKQVENGWYNCKLGIFRNNSPYD